MEAKKVAYILLVIFAFAVEAKLPAGDANGNFNFTNFSTYYSCFFDNWNNEAVIHFHIADSLIIGANAYKANVSFKILLKAQHYIRYIQRRVEYSLTRNNKKRN